MQLGRVAGNVGGMRRGVARAGLWAAVVAGATGVPGAVVAPGALGAVVATVAFGGCADERHGAEDARDATVGDATNGDVGGDDDGSADDTDVGGETASDSAHEAEAVGSEATWIELRVDAREVAIVGGRSAALTFEVPPDALAVSIVVVGVAPTLYALDSWTTPAATLVDAGWLDTDPGAFLQLCAGCANRIWAIPGVFSAVAPNAPDVLLAPGTHTVTLLSDPPTSETVRVWVHFKRPVASGASLPAAGTLDLDLYFTGAQGLSAATAPSDPAFQARLAAVAAIYAEVGLVFGRVAYADVDPRFRDIESINGADSDLAALFATGRDDPAAANLYFVDSIFEGGNFFGFSGGIPGPTALDGTGRSGVAIALAPIPGFPDMVNTTIAHELAHFLGLYHTSEARPVGKPQIDDALSDTPSGPSTNLMHFMGGGETLTPMQGVVMRTSFWTRHPLEAP